ncbi:MAG: lipid-A-disaccharide synthase [Lactobacillus sp.]|jgi:lipid-A-disaccharide synthase|nr:lipid-A-disaccharide synthase [Lactobacillus sp.]
MKDLKIYLIAGEPSGDALGSRLMKALVRKAEGNVEFFGVGGENMEKEGLKSLFDITDLAIMGLAEVIPSIPKVLKLMKRTVEDIKKVNPDIVVSIDSWSFCSRVHKKLKKLNLDIPQVHYVAPQVWAWKKKRAKTMHKYIDHLLTLLPQEPKYFTPHGLDTTFVGHPVIESSVVTADGQDFRRKYNIPADKLIVSLLPGSRHNEVSRLFPVFLTTAKMMMEAEDRYVFVVPTVKTVSNRVKKMAETAKVPVVIVEGSENRHQAIKASSVAMAASGTVALELAIANVPHIIAYKVSPLSAMLARKFLKIQFVNLSNIILGREIVPELLQERAVPGNIKQYMTELLSKKDLYEKQMEGFDKVREKLGLGEQTPSENAADVIIKIATREKCEDGVNCIFSYKD